MSVRLTHEEARILAAAVRGEGGTDRAAEIAARLVEVTAPLPELPDDGRPPVVLMVHTETPSGRDGYEEEPTEVPAAVWEAMTPEQRDAYAEELCSESADQRCPSGWYVAGED